MKYLIALLLIAQLGFVGAQAIYDANGQYKGYQQTSPSGVTNTYNAQGQNIGSSQVDQGQTSFYSPAGAYQGTNTATPAPIQPNTTINTPRQVPQAPSVKGW
ncbi:hypothetical protein [Polynucleobacter antarcticus]|uniref:YD repeat-containing protein n=1 Tax=Polynucleobacter antarcticus TaxID=1743162 RepID=A0A6M9PSW5_9BURK|nr:hypothetical protein [Polynucleobacter antarcticus]QKM62942.1 hypothetical protein DCO16_07660 [Polynucleobacter antarcticus]